MLIKFFSTFIPFLFIANLCLAQDFSLLKDSAVYINFAVEKNGTPTKVKIEKIICKKCSKEFKEKLKHDALLSFKNMTPFKYTDGSRTRTVIITLTPKQKETTEEQIEYLKILN